MGRPWKSAALVDTSASSPWERVRAAARTKRGKPERSETPGLFPAKSAAMWGKRPLGQTLSTGAVEAAISERPVGTEGWVRLQSLLNRGQRMSHIEFVPARSAKR